MSPSFGLSRPKSSKARHPRTIQIGFMLRALLKQHLGKKLIVAPGVFDGISVRLAETHGFDCLYMTGYGTVASHLGLPDAGLASYKDMVDRVRILSALSSAPLIADGDTGYGGLLNVEHTVRGYEDAGAAAIQLEDQQFPKKCGHTPMRRVIPLDEAAKKIRVACDARQDMLVVARTDARTMHGLDEALRRADAFVEAGADLIFVEAPESLDDMATIGRALKGVPLVVNVVEGGKTPVLSPDAYLDLGYALAIYPATAFLALAKAVDTVYAELKSNGTSLAKLDHLADFAGFSKTMGFDAVWAFERAHAEDAP